MDERSYPTRVVELPLEYSQVIGLPSGLRRCAGPTVLELWFEGSGGPATCARLVAQLLQKAFGRGLMYMRTSVPLPGPGIEEVTFNGIAFQAVLDSSRIADLLAAGWNSEL